MGATPVFSQRVRKALTLNALGKHSLFKSAQVIEMAAFDSCTFGQKSEKSERHRA